MLNCCARSHNENGSSMGRAVGSSARGERIDAGRLVLVNGLAVMRTTCAKLHLVFRTFCRKAIRAMMIPAVKTDVNLII